MALYGESGLDELLRLDLRAYTLALLKQIPKGRVTTYRALALALGDARAARAVGQILADNPEPDVYPCYKVVHSDGRVGEYSGPGGLDEKIQRLRREGIPVRDGRIPDLKRYAFHGFKTDRPLEKLRRLQEELAARVVKEPALSLDDVHAVGGVDLSYPGPWEGVGAYVSVARGTLRPLAAETHRCEVAFPYIPTYLAFRELPVLLPLLRRVRERNRLADVILVDGSGILHPRHAGIASHLGVLLDHPTVGVIKRLLYGRVDVKGMARGEMRPVRDPETGDVIGMAVKTHERADPLYVSIGHKVDLAMAVRLVLELAKGHKLPEPIRRAHELCTRAARSPLRGDPGVGVGKEARAEAELPLLAQGQPSKNPKAKAEEAGPTRAEKKPKQMALDL